MASLTFKLDLYKLLNKKNYFELLKYFLVHEGNRFT